jgi:lipopolysaccharide export system permease protein
MMKYLTLEVFISFFVGTAIFSTILLMLQGIRLSEFMVVHQVSIWNCIKLFFSMFVSFFPVTLPIGFLFSVLIGMSRVNAESEMIALQSAGISLKQVYFPLFIFSVFMTVLCTYIALFTVPKGNRAFELLISKLGSERIISQLRPGVFENFFGMTLLAENVLPIQSELKKIFIYDERDEFSPLAITAQEGILKSNVDEGFLTLRLTNGQIQIDSKVVKSELQKINFEVYDINLKLPESGGGWRDYSLPSLDYFQLKEKLELAKHDLPQYRSLQVEYHRRFSLSFACIILSFLGFSVSLLAHKGIRGAALVICIIVTVLYWLAYISVNAFSASGLLIPWIGLWIPNVFFLFVAFLFYRFRRYS